MSSDQNKHQQSEMKLLDPENSFINVSNKRTTKTYYTVSKLILRKFGHLELQSLGSAADNSVRLAEFLERNKLAVIEKIDSNIVDISDLKSQSGSRTELAFSVKLVKSKEFDDLTKELK